MRKKTLKTSKEKRPRHWLVYHKVLAGWFPTSSQNTGHLASQNGMESKSFKKKHTSFEITNQHIYARLLAGDIPTLVLIAYCLKQPTSTCLIHFSVAHVESTSLRKAQHMWNGFRRLDPDPILFHCHHDGWAPKLDVCSPIQIPEGASVLGFQ